MGGLLLLFGFAVVGVSQLVARRLPRSVVVEFLPPVEGNIFHHGLALRADRRVLSAALLDLAVRRQIRVLTSGGKRGPVAIQVHPDALLTLEERTFLAAFRPRHLSRRQEARYLRALEEIGVTPSDPEMLPDVYFLRGKGAFRGHRRRWLTKFFDGERARMVSDGLTRKWANNIHLVLLSLLFLAAVLAATLFVIGAILDQEWVAALAIVLDVALLFWVLTLAPPPLLRFTEQGEALRRHLSGLRDYMRMAEQERIRVLQSPEGALRTPAGALTVGGQVLGLEAQPSAGDPVAQSALDRYVLTERLLPYAILFRQEKQWQKEFEHLGGPVEVSRNMRTLGQTLEGVVAVVQVLVIILQILRVVGAVLSLFGGRR